MRRWWLETGSGSEAVIVVDLVGDVADVVAGDVGEVANILRCWRGCCGGDC